MLLMKNPMKWVFYGSIELVYRVRRALGERREVLAHGSVPARPYLQYKVFKLLGLRTVSASAAPAVTYVHIDATQRDTAAGINGRCSDISKSRVAKASGDIFGYPLAVDPLPYKGKIVRKGEANAAHDGAIVVAPVQPEAGFVYQRLVDGTDERGRWTDFRPCVVGNEIAFVYVKKRSSRKQFANDGNRVSLVSPDHVFSRDEIGLLLRVARELNLDVGEMDVLRDRGNGKLYVVDVANTPHSPGDAFISIDGFMAMLRAAEAFKRQFLAAA